MRGNYAPEPTCWIAAAGLYRASDHFADGVFQSDIAAGCTGRSTATPQR